MKVNVNLQGVHKVWIHRGFHYLSYCIYGNDQDMPASSASQFRTRFLMEGWRREYVSFSKICIRTSFKQYLYYGDFWVCLNPQSIRKLH